MHVELLRRTDLLFIAASLHARMPAPTLHRMVACLQRLHHDANVSRAFGGAGGPWEFNLRDLLRWCELAESAVPEQQQQQQQQQYAADAPPGEQNAGEAAALDCAVRHYASLLFLQRLRTAADRQHAATVFSEAWGVQQWSVEQQLPELHISPAVLSAGWAYLPRASSVAAAAGGTAAALDGIGSAAQQLALLPRQLPVLESLAECAARSWMCLLVGPTASGKTALVRSLAALAGQPLLELSLTSGTDTSDLLGGFEQVEPARKVQELAREVQALLAGAAEMLLLALHPQQAQPQQTQLHQQLLQALSQAWQTATGAASLDAVAAAAGGSAAAAATTEAQHAQQAAAVTALQQVLAQLHQMLAALPQLEGASGERGSPHHQQLERLEEGTAAAAARAGELAASLAGGAELAAGKFEWVDGALTR